MKAVMYTQFEDVEGYMFAIQIERARPVLQFDEALDVDVAAFLVE